MLIPHDRIYQNYYSTSQNQKQSSVDSTVSSNLKTLSLSNYFTETIDYRKHTALKIKVKPRQALASVNIKLLEQQNSSKPNTNRSKSSKNERYIVTNDEEDSDRIITTTPSLIQKDESSNNVQDYLSANKDAFRPSTVKKRNKTANSISNSSTDDHRHPIRAVSSKSYYSDKSLMSKISKVPFLSTNRITNDSPSTIEEKHNRRPLQKEISNYDEENNENSMNNLNQKSIINENNKIDFDFEDNFKDSSNSAMNTPRNHHHQPHGLQAPIVNQANKSASDLFKEVMETAIKSSHPPPTSHRLTKSMSAKVTSFTSDSNYFNNKEKLYAMYNSRLHADSVLTNKSNSTNNNNRSSPVSNKNLDVQVIDKLNENQFLAFLKEYRRTKSINLESVATLSMQPNENSNGITRARLSSDSRINSSTHNEFNSNKLHHPTNTINLQAQFVRLPTAHAGSSNPTWRTNSAYKTNTTTPLGMYNTTIDQNNLNRSSNYFVNYVNNKILVKNSKNLVVCLDNNNNNNKQELKQNPTNNPNPNENSTKLIEKQQQQIKILNFPAVAN